MVEDLQASEEEMNPVLILTHNNLELTKRCVESVKAQDIPTRIIVYDNGSSDGTREWFSQHRLEIDTYYGKDHNSGVSAGWNCMIDACLHYGDDEHILVVGNDTVLAPWTYSALLSADVPFVTGVDVGMSPLPDKPDVFPLSPHPDFSCFLIRRECWEKVGPFDERMVNYCGDCDFHIRAHRLGIPLCKASIPYNHERSSTINKANAQEKAHLHWQANKDREVFKSIYGCLPGTAAYNDLFKEVEVGKTEAQ